MKAEGAEYKGVLYCGLMMTARGPMVLEFNCRFGDPETQPILMRMESDLVEAHGIACIDGRTSDGDFKWSSDAAVCVVMASGGYPGAYEIGEKDHRDSTKPTELEGVKIFHAGTIEARRRLLHRRRPRAGSDCARAADLQTAVDRAYEACGENSISKARTIAKTFAARALKKTITSLIPVQRWALPLLRSTGAEICARSRSSQRDWHGPVACRTASLNFSSSV